MKRVQPRGIGNASIEAGCLRACGIRVPIAASVASFDTAPVTSVFTPMITTPITTPITSETT